MSRIEFEFSVSALHPSLPGHFPGQPIVPGVLLLDQVMAAVQRASGRSVVRVQNTKFLSALRPEEVATATFKIEGTKATFAVSAMRNGDSLLLAEGVLQLAPMEPAA